MDPPPLSDNKETVMKRKNKGMNTLRRVAIAIVMVAMLVVVLRAMAWADKGMYEQGNTESIWTPSN